MDEHRIPATRSTTSPDLSVDRTEQGAHREHRSTRIGQLRHADARSEPASVLPRQTRRRTKTHEHAWQTQSCHPTSDGVIRYQQCHCGSWRVLLGACPMLAARPGALMTGDGHHNQTAD